MEQANASHDLFRQRAGWWVWCPPAALIVVGSISTNGHSILPFILDGIILVAASGWIGVACFWNARRCGRVHCAIDGVLLPLLGLVGVINLIGFIKLSWNLYSAILIGIVALSFVPELFGLRYLRTTYFN